MSSPPPADPLVDQVRRELAGQARVLKTPFGNKPFLYADYTASGRHFGPIERHLEELAGDYANPHSEDSATGRTSNAWMREAEAVIRRNLNADKEDCLLPCGAGATGAIHKLQEILGLIVTAAAHERLVRRPDGERIVVFLGPYEHHSNELSWRDSLAETVTIGLAADGGIDFDDLDRALADPRFAGWRKIGAFSAASNVTGIKTDVRRLAKLLHAHGAILCLDCAASAPYWPVDMHPADEPEAAVDAVYLSPHKFIGGPGACGLLAFSSKLYRRDLPPSQSAGGTVRYVWPGGHDFIEDIEARERAGTPGLPQLVRAALAMQLQREVGPERIAAREHAALARAFDAWCNHPRIDVLGPQEPERRLGIVSFNLRDRRGEVVPPRLVTVLLNDLFGIQSRAGCSCAGPYGHALLGIDEAQSMAIRERVLAGETGARPGWCRVSLHWVMEDAEIDYLIAAVSFLADHADRFADLYIHDDRSGAWCWKGAEAVPSSVFPARVLSPPPQTGVSAEQDDPARFARALAEAEAHLAALGISEPQ